MKYFKNLENKTPSDTYRRIQLLCKKVQAHSPLQQPLKYNQNQMPLTFLTILGLTEILCSFRLVPD